MSVIQNTNTWKKARWWGWWQRWILAFIGLAELSSKILLYKFCYTSYVAQNFFAQDLLYKIDTFWCLKFYLVMACLFSLILFSNFCRTNFVCGSFVTQFVCTNYCFKIFYAITFYTNFCFKLCNSLFCVQTFASKFCQTNFYKLVLQISLCKPFLQSFCFQSLFELQFYRQSNIKSRKRMKSPSIALVKNQVCVS